MKYNYFISISFFLVISQLVFASDASMLAQNKESHEATAPDQKRQTELLYMIRHDCGSCHGMTLKGGLGPSLLPQRIALLPHKYLSDAIASGRKGTPMPPWAEILTPAEIDWIVIQLKAGIDNQSMEKTLATPEIATSIKNEKTQ